MPPNKMNTEALSNVSNDVVDEHCFHCGQPIPLFCDLSVCYKKQEQAVCCHGCKAAFEFIQSHGMTDFYRYRGDKLPELPTINRNAGEGRIDPRWLAFSQEDVLVRYVEVDGDRFKSLIYIQGMYCSSCAWLIEKALSQLSGELNIQLNVDTHYLQLYWPKDSTLDFSQILQRIASLGYQPRPLAVDELLTDSSYLRQLENRKSLKRLAVAGLGMMQVMTYAVSLYLGDYQGMDGDLRQFFVLVSLLVATVVVFYSGRPFFRHAWFDIKNRHLGMDVPVAIAIGSAYFFSVFDVFFRDAETIYFDSAVMFVFFLSLGRYVEMRARYQAASSSQALLHLLPPIVTVHREHPQQTQGKEKSEWKECVIEPRAIEVGDRLQFVAGEIIACDGIIGTGSVTVDESVLNGESTPVLKSKGALVIAGSVIRQGEITVHATQAWRDSSLAVVDRLLGASNGAHQSEASLPLMDKIARHFVATILLLTVCVATFWWLYAPERLFEIVLAMLIASCPCAFSLATPVVMTVAAQWLRQRGILLTNFAALSKLKDVSHWCFDKTGTLTQGQMQIADIQVFTEMSETQVLQVIASLEGKSQHPSASAFAHVAKPYEVVQLHEVSGCGLSGEIDQQRYYLGKPDWVMQQAGLKNTLSLSKFNDDNASYSHIALALENKLLATVAVGDKTRSEAKAALVYLSEKAEEVIILSGDRQEAVDHFSNSLELTLTSYGDLLPQQKVGFITAKQQQGAVIAMVGDGVNDAPVLQQADVSVAMASGSQISQSHADVVLLGGGLNSLRSLYQMAERAQKVIQQNMAWAIAYNLLILPLAAMGLLTPWLAALGMSLSSLLVVLNAQRLKL